MKNKGVGTKPKRKKEKLGERPEPQLDGVRTRLNYMIGPDSDPRFDYSQMIGPLVVDHDE